jgi:hypothetical protein
MKTGQDTGQDTGTPLVDAATLLGTTPAALRKRLQRGSVPGYKREGQWFVLVEAALPMGSPRVAHGQPTALARTDDQRAADLAMVLDRVAAMYEAQLAAKDSALVAKDETIAELRRRAEVAESERSDLARQLAEAALAAASAPPAAPPPPSAAPMPSAYDDTPVAPVPAGGFWGWVRRAFGGE